TNGNVVTLSYATYLGEENLNQVYLSEIRYGPGAAGAGAYHFIRFKYESRPDWFEDCRPGFPLRTGMRLGKVVIGTNGVTLPGHAAINGGILNRRYDLDYDAHPHWSLLTSITPVGADGVSSLPPAVFDYTVCNPPATVAADSAAIGSRNTPVRVMDNDAVDLVDLNGDGLPDILETEPYGGEQTAYLNLGEATDARDIVWSSAKAVEGDQRAWNVNLAESVGAIAHLADMNGDGLADLAYKTDEDVYYFANSPSPGHVSWGNRKRMNLDPSTSDPPSPFGVEHVKTADLDFDKRMDIIQSVSVGEGASYRIWLNLGGQAFSRAFTVGQDNGFMLSDTGVHIADVNGDRVPDVVRVRPTGLQVTAGLGYGNFLPLATIPLPDYTLTDEQVAQAKLEDITGDGLADLVVERAQPGQLWYWVNLGTYTLEARRMVTGTPSVMGTGFEIRWADLNGNGSTDLIYADHENSPRIQTVDIGELIGCVPSPNLLKTIENGIGRVTTLDYATSTRYVLEDGQNWPDPLPFPVDVVSQVTVEDSLGSAYVTTLHYHEGYYDPEEHEFRGFAKAEQMELGDASAPTLVTRFEFDTGRNVEAMKGKILRQAAEDDEGKAFWDEETVWDARTLFSGTDGKDVAFAHPTTRSRLITERGFGTPVELKWAFEYDDYGNLTRQVEYGRKDAGWDDERVTETAFTAGGTSGQTAWILNGVVERSVLHLDDTLVAQTRNYYDGNNTLYDVSEGNLTKTEDWVAGATYVTSLRNVYDAYGNLTIAYDALHGTEPGHSREFVYDSSFHALPVEEHIATGSLTLSMFAQYDYGLGVVKSSTEFNGHTTTCDYDTFGRLTAINKPLDTPPSVAYTYVLAHPLTGGGVLNWVETRQRDGSAGDGFLHARVYYDGLGRALMTRSEGEDPGEVVVSDVTDYNARGLPWRTYLPYFDDPSDLDYHAPAGTSYLEHHYDAQGREIRTVQPDGSYATTTYKPMVRVIRDEEQTRAGSPHEGCGMRYISDGLLDEEGNGRLRNVFELVKLSDLGETGPLTSWLTSYTYDLLGNLTGYTDSQNNRKFIEYDG
ncbi:MAG: hypothetical protein GY851_22740, partial [bacterium]|nr:hypothetical protein [bacterium]